MQSKKYADTDFFLAILKDSDWLKEKARKIYNEHKGNIWITPFTVVELMIICLREKIQLKETLLQISRIAKLDGMQWGLFFETGDYVNKGATIFDSLLMAFSKNDDIISSDNIYKKFGFKVINLRD